MEPTESRDSNGNLWTLPTLKAYLEQRFADERRFYDQVRVNDKENVSIALAAAKEAVRKAEESQEAKNQSQNEFRKSLSDLSALMIQRSEALGAVEALKRELNIQISAIEMRMAGFRPEAMSAIDNLKRETDIQLSGNDARMSAIESRVGNLDRQIAIAGGKSTGISSSLSTVMAAAALIGMLVFGILSLVLHASLPEVITHVPK